MLINIRPFSIFIRMLPLVSNREFHELNRSSTSLQIDQRYQDSHKIIIPVQEVEPIIVINDNIKECRICLEQEGTGILIQPCKCMGSISYTHFHCLSQWIKHKINPKDRLTVLCEVCEEQFTYKLVKKADISCEKIFDHYKKNPQRFHYYFGVFIVALLCLFGLATIFGLGISSSSIGNKIKQLIFIHDNMTTILLSAIIFFAVLISLAVLIFIIQYGINTKIDVKQILSHHEKMAKNKGNIRIYQK